MSLFSKFKPYPWKSVLLRYIIAAALVFADVGVKLLVEARQTAIDGITLIPRVVGLSYVRNTGAAFGMLDDNTLVVSVISCIIILAGIFLIAVYTPFNKGESFILAVIIAGGIGNQIDRIARGYVTDYLKFLFFKFPVFNLADIFVTCGCITLAVFVIISMSRSRKQPETKPDEC